MSVYLAPPWQFTTTLHAEGIIPQILQKSCCCKGPQERTNFAGRVGSTGRAAALAATWENNHCQKHETNGSAEERTTGQRFSVVAFLNALTVTYCAARGESYCSTTILEYDVMCLSCSTVAFVREHCCVPWCS